MTGKVSVVSCTVVPGQEYWVTNTFGNSGYPVNMKLIRLLPQGLALFHNGEQEVICVTHCWTEDNKMHVGFKIYS